MRQVERRGPAGPRFAFRVAMGSASLVMMSLELAFGERVRVIPPLEGPARGLVTALATGSPGDTLVLEPGVYRGTFELRSGVSIVGRAGPDSTILDADGGRYVLSGRGVDSTTVIAGLTLRNGRRDHPNSGGGGIYLHRSSPIIVHNVFRDHLGYFGPGVYTNYDCHPIVAYNVFHDNEGYLGGALAAYERCDPLIYDNFVFGNRAVSGGALLSMNSAPVVMDNTLVGNRAEPGGGGAVYGDSSPALIAGNVIAFNEDPKRDGGAVYFLDADRPATIRENLVWENEGNPHGGACAPYLGLDGNCSEDPGFVDRGRFVLERRPAVDGCLPEAGADRWDGTAIPQVPDSILATWRAWRRSHAR